MNSLDEDSLCEELSFCSSFSVCGCSVSRSSDLVLSLWPYNKYVDLKTADAVFGKLSNQGEKVAYTLDTKVGEIVKDSHAVEILERHAPGVSKNPMIGLAKGMTLKSLLAMPQAKQAGVTEEMVTKVLAEINARK